MNFSAQKSISFCRNYRSSNSSEKIDPFTHLVMLHWMVSSFISQKSRLHPPSLILEISTYLGLSNNRDAPKLPNLLGSNTFLTHHAWRVPYFQTDLLSYCCLCMLYKMISQVPHDAISQYTYTYTYTYAYTYIYIHTCMHAYIHTCMHACMHTYILTLHYTTLHYITLHYITYIYYIYIYKYMYIYIYTYVCISTYDYVYIHT